MNLRRRLECPLQWFALDDEEEDDDEDEVDEDLELGPDGFGDWP